MGIRPGISVKANRSGKLATSSPSNAVCLEGSQATTSACAIACSSTLMDLTTSTCEYPLLGLTCIDMHPDTLASEHETVPLEIECSAASSGFPAGRAKRKLKRQSQEHHPDCNDTRPASSQKTTVESDRPLDDQTTVLANAARPQPHTAPRTERQASWATRVPTCSNEDSQNGYWIGPFDSAMLNLVQLRARDG